MLGAITGFLRGSEGLCGHGAPTRHAQKKCPDTGGAGAVCLSRRVIQKPGTATEELRWTIACSAVATHRDRFARGVAEMPPRRRRHTLMTGCPTDGTAHENIFKLWRRAARHLGLDDLG